MVESKQKQHFIIGKYLVHPFYRSPTNKSFICQKILSFAFETENLTRRQIVSSVAGRPNSTTKKELMTHIIEEQHKKLREDLKKDQQEAILELKAELTVIKEGVEDSKAKIYKLESEVTDLETNAESTQSKIREEVNRKISNLNKLSSLMLQMKNLWSRFYLKLPEIVIRS